MAKKEVTAEKENAGETGVYELGFHLVSSLSEAEVGEEVTRLKDLIAAKGGVFIADEFPKEMPLAYEMVKVVVGKRERHTKSYFGWVKFEIGAGEVPGLLTEIETRPSVLRALLVKTVRENTMIGKRIFTSASLEGETIKRKDVKEAAPAGPVSEEELDRSIEKMVAE